jgi:hypothetical protein
VVNVIGVLRAVLAIASADLAASWQLAAHHVTPSAVLAAAAVALVGVAIAVLAEACRPASARAARLLIQRAAALRRRSWGAAFQRQRNPDAAGRPRPRAPSAAQTAA